jgi:hypothetical protein
LWWFADTAIRNGLRWFTDIAIVVCHVGPDL